MTKNQLWVLFTYLVSMILPSYIIAFVVKISDFLYNSGITTSSVDVNALSFHAITASSLTCLVITLVLLKGEMKDSFQERGIITKKQLLLAISGIFLLLLSQTITITIEQLIGIPAESANTTYITEMIISFPIFMLLPVIYAPILEEIIFRKFLFGSVNRKWGLIAAYMISAFVFGLVHFDLPHLLTYFGMGIVLAFLYHRTGRIIVPMIAHGGMNLLVLIGQLSYL